MNRTRNKMLNIRLTDEEYEKIINKIKEAKETGRYKTYADYLVDIIDKSTIKIYQIDLQKWDKELSAIGKNINQWTKRINTYNEITRYDVDSLEQEMILLWQLLKSLKKEIQGSIKNILLKAN